MYIRKRNDKLQSFNREKIYTAVKKACTAAGCASEDVIKLMDFEVDEEESVESIQDKIVNILRVNKHYHLANIFSSYRSARQMNRINKAIRNKFYELENTEDRSNANANSKIAATQRSLMASETHKQLYQSDFITPAENEANDKGFIYIHDIGNRLTTYNCCLFNADKVMKNGFVLENMIYNEPKGIVSACMVLSDMISSAAGNQYGGFTVPQIDEILSYYCAKSYEIYRKEYIDIIAKYNILPPETDIDEYAFNRIKTELTQRIQGLEYSLNSIASSRGDFAFVTFTFGHGTDRWSRLVSSVIMDVRKKGQGAPGKEAPVVFPKLVFIYDSTLHGEGAPMEDLFKEAIECSKIAQYPDYLSLDAGYIGDVYKKWGKIISPMGCRAFLSPVFKKSGTYEPKDETDEFLIYRCNLGVISLNLPLIYQYAKTNGIGFFDTLRHYMEMIRDISKRTIMFLQKKKSDISPLVFSNGGFDGGNIKSESSISPVLKYSTISFGYGALNELQVLHNGKTIYEDGDFAYKTLKFMADTIDEYKHEDGILYALYGTPGESWLPLACKQFVEMFGEIPGVTDKGYFTNSFHCAVTEDITPMEKMDAEYKFWNLPKGGRIMYGRFNTLDNTEGIIATVREAMRRGLYYGVNHNEDHCLDCGTHYIGDDTLEEPTCPCCGSHKVLQIRRMNGYLGYSNTLAGKTKFNPVKAKEFKDRKSM